MDKNTDYQVQDAYKNMTIGIDGQTRKLSDLNQAEINSLWDKETGKTNPDTGLRERGGYHFRQYLQAKEAKVITAPVATATGANKDDKDGKK